ncbi:LEM domain-containing protein 1 isoform X1 [Rana temporaria]|uniref:LEM domain-containing protein 1 isoform X1 n=1 Tax=Rana temporaria TaxID=8407 RepID=UPI001AADB600|nr:LEM domain-containing protein 1 isoform X1 [Rana temporaria]XP_040193480.1 LEM domain-containing protein 1 isoform X1 [Rana temporaria]XP_040193481.1 LEM domain-containing protein 1 isoform X1 [Rana temporaria]
MDIRSLSNIELKEQLLKHGINPGPILPSTRSVYEKKLQKLLKKVQENGDAHDDQYSDSDDEGAQFKDIAGLGNEVHFDGEDGTILKNYSRTNVYTVNVPVPRRSSLPSSTRPSAGQYTHIPACIAAEFNQNIATLGDDFSVTKMLKQMERRSSLGQPSGNKNKDGKNQALKSQEKVTADKNTMTYRSPANTPKACVFLKQNRHQPEDATSGDLYELLSQSALGMSATRRKPIKGAAGRPIQFQYDDIVRRAKIKEQTKEIQEEKKPQCLISVPLRIAIFVLVAFVVLVLLTMESSPENPFEPPTEDTHLQQH